MGQFLEAMDTKWAKHAESATQNTYKMLRPSLQDIDALKSIIEAVMRDVYFPLQKEYATTTYGAFLARQVAADPEGKLKYERVEEAVKAKIKIYWQTVASSLKDLDVKDMNATVQGENIRSVMRAFIPDALDDNNERQSIADLAKDYARCSEEATANANVKKVEDKGWLSINNAFLMMVLEAGVGAEISAAKGLSSLGSARAGGCDEAGNRLKAEFKNLPEVSRLALVSEGMSLMLAALTSIEQLSKSDDMDRLEILIPTVLANVSSVVHGNDLHTQKEGGLYNMLIKLYQIEMLESLLTIDQQKDQLVNADLRKDIVALVFETITKSLDATDLTNTLRLRTFGLAVTEDCENPRLSVHEIVANTKQKFPEWAKRLDDIAARAKSKFLYGVHQAFPLLEMQVETPLKSGKASHGLVSLSEVLIAIDAAITQNKQDMLKHYDCNKAVGQPLAAQFKLLRSKLNEKKPGFEHVLNQLVISDSSGITDMTIAGFLEAGLGFRCPVNKNAEEIWMAIENDIALSKDPLVVVLKSYREMLMLTMKMQKIESGLIQTIKDKSAGSTDPSMFVALEFAAVYSDVVDYGNKFNEINRRVFENLSGFNVLNPSCTLSKQVSARDVGYKPMGDLQRCYQAFQRSNAGKTMSAEKTNVMRLAVVLYEFAAQSAPCEQYAASKLNELSVLMAALDETIPDQLKTHAQAIAEKIKEVEMASASRQNRPWFGMFALPAGSSSSAQDPKGKLLGTIATINAYKPAAKMN